MDAQKVDMFIMANSKFFESHQVPYIHDQMLKMDDSKFILLQSMNFRDPSTLLIVSLLGGSLGIDRFMLGETGLGIAKLLTCGGLGIWSIVDWFLIMGHTREVNMQKLQTVMY